jgi:LysW-gamma-L-lysine carboxypeptidase
VTPDADGTADPVADRAVSAAAARELLVEMVETPSPSGEAAAAAERLLAFFEAHGREAYRDEVGNVRVPGDDALLLTSHLDTVPGDIDVRVEGAGEDAMLWGRGSVDATGPLCALAVAAVESGASFAGVVREETDSAGARHLVVDRSTPGAVVNGEPSGWDAVTLGYRGYLPAVATAETDAVHSSRPDDGAVEAVLAWWADVEATVDDDEDGPVFESVTAAALAVEGGPTDDGLGVAAELDAAFRLPPGTDAGTVRAAATDLADDHGVDLTFGDPVAPLLSSPRTDLAAAFRRAIRAAGGEPTHLRKTGTADANLYADAWDCPVLTYGPGDSALDHAPDERLSLANYDRAVDVATAVAVEVVG